jgi:branched-chain amino acid transport system permease protein
VSQRGGRNLEWALAAAGAVVVLGVLPFSREALDFPIFYLVFLSTIAFWAAQATSWNILSGYSGYFSFGQGAFLGVGTYTAAVLAGRHDVNFFVTIPVAAVLSVALALAVGGLAFRLRSLRGEIFALLTLAVPFILASLARINSSIDGGQGVIVPIPEYPEALGEFQELVYLLNLAVVLGALALAFAMEKTRYGWALFAIRDAEDVAEGLGVPTFTHKMIAISATGLIAGVSGAVFALQLGFVTVEGVFGLTVPLYVIVMSVLGGRAHWVGPLLGAIVVVTLQDRLADADVEGWSLVILGAILVALVLIAPEGLHARLRVRPWATLGAFAGVVAVLAVLRVWGELLDWLAAGMVAAAVVAFWPVRRRRRTRAELSPERSGDETVADEEPPPDEAAEEVSGNIALESIAEPTGDGAVGNGAPVVEVMEVTKRFGGVNALDGVSFQVRAGELVGLVGPNGSGKTTLVNLIAGSMRPTSGELRIDGRRANGLRSHHVAHLGVARTYQIPRPFESMTVRDNVALAIMFGRQRRRLTVARREADEHLELVGLHRRAAAFPSEINLHERQLLEMARAVATRPKVLLLDEALAGLNPVEIDNAVAVVRTINESGIAIVIVEHLLRVVNQLATRIVVLEQGRCLAEGDPRTVMQDPDVVRAYLGKHAHA